MADFDLIVVGGGPAGYVGAIRAAQLGLKVACIEKDKTLGGTCLNVGCIPSKALLESSEHYYQAKMKFAKHGITVGDLKVDLEQMMKRKDGVVRQLTTGIAGLFKKNKIEWLAGMGRLNGKSGEEFNIEIDGAAGKKTYTAKRVLLATGSEVSPLPFLPFDGKTVLSSTEALALPEIPKHLIVIGGGVIGLEMGSVWARLGAKVTVIEFQDRIAAGFDLEASNELQKSLERQGLEFKLSHKCLSGKATGTGMSIEVEDMKAGAKFTIEGDKILVSVGRRPFTKDIGLGSVKIETDKQGRIPVNSNFETSVPGIYAVGDIIDGPMLAHKAEEEGIAAVEVMCGMHGHVNYMAIPGVVYTHPELACVGYTEEELKEMGIAYKKGSFPFQHNGRAKAMEETEGFVKILADSKTDKILGAHIVGARAGDLIAEIVTTIDLKGTVDQIGRSSHAHPSLPEIVKEAALAVGKKQIHG